MSMTNAVDANYAPKYYAQTQSIVSSNSDVNSECREASIYTSASDSNSASVSVPENKDEKIDVDYACTDGKDDGKLEAGEVAESIGKGILKSAKNMVTAPFKEASKGNFLPLAAVVGGALLCATPIGAPIAVIGGALGLAKGATDIVGGVVKANEIANSADGTDGEAKAALEQVGSGVLTTGLSLTAIFGGLKTMKGRADSNMGRLAKRMEAGEKVGFGEKVKAFGSDTINSGKETFGKLTAPARNRAEIRRDAKAQEQYAKDNNLGDKKLSQDDIDSLIKEMETDSAAQEQYIKDKGLDGEKVLSQKDINKMFDDINGNAEGKMSQGDIDNLIEEIRADNESVTQYTQNKGLTGEKVLSQSEVDSLLKEIQADNEAVAQYTQNKKGLTGKKVLSQTEVDSLLKEIQADNDAVAQYTQNKKGLTGKKVLSQTEIDNLIKKSNTLQDNMSASEKTALNLKEELDALSKTQPKGRFGTVNRLSKKWKAWNNDYQAKRNEWKSAYEQYQKYKNQYEKLGIA